MFAKAVNAICFWLLTGLAFVLFLIAVVMPPFREYNMHVRTEQNMQQALRDFQALCDASENRRNLARRGDPLWLAEEIRKRENLRPQGQTIPIRPIDRDLDAARRASPDSSVSLSGRPDLEDVIVGVTGKDTYEKLENPRVQRLLLLTSCVAICMAFIFFGDLPRKKNAEDRRQKTGRSG